MLIDITDALDHMTGAVGGDDGVEHLMIFMLMGTLGVHDGCTVMGFIEDHLRDLLCLVCDDKERLALEITVEGMQGLGGYVLEHDRIQRLIPAEKHTGGTEDQDIEAENQVPGLHAALLAEVDGDKIRTTSGRIYTQAEADDHAVDDTAEDGDQQGVIGDYVRRHHISEKAGQENHDQREEGELLSDEAETDIDRDRIQQDIDRRVWNLMWQIHLADTLDQDRQSRRTAWIESTGTDKCFDIDRHQERGQHYGNQTAQILLRFDFHFYSSCPMADMIKHIKSRLIRTRKHISHSRYSYILQDKSTFFFFLYSLYRSGNSSAKGPLS